MKDPFLLHMFNPTRNVSPFDVNMAYEAGYNDVIPYSGVILDEIPGLVQDTIFSRGPKGVKRTGIFIGGREFGLAVDMLEAAKGAMVPPFEVSVFADPSGAFTTAAAVIACVESWVDKKKGVSLEGLNMYVFGGTGPVGLCAGVIAAECGANVFLGSRRNAEHVRAIAEPFNKRYGVHMDGADSRIDDALVLPFRAAHMLNQAHVIINTAKAGVRVVKASDLKDSKALIVAADCNAVPPLGIEGVDVNDMGKILEVTPSKAVGIGALAIGNVKYKVHSKLCQMMIETSKPLYLDFQDAFKVAREYAREA